jgi:hypothetical protein
MQYRAVLRLMSRVVPVSWLIIYFVYLKVLNSKECDDLYRGTYGAVVGFIAAGCLLQEFMLNLARNKNGGGPGVCRAIIDATMSSMLLMGAILLVGGPAACLFPHGFYQSASVGTALVVIAVVVSVVRACLVTREASEQGMRAFVQMTDVENVPEESQAPVQAHYLILLVRAMTMDVRRKFPFYTWVVHLVASFAIAGRKVCDAVPVEGYIVYICVFQAFVFWVSFVEAATADYVHSKVERFVVAFFEAITVCGTLLGLMFIVDHPISCINKTGVPMVHVVSYVLLLVFLFLSVTNSYLVVRTMPGSTLARMVRGVVPRKHH